MTMIGLIAVGLIMVVGLIGVVVPILPGGILVLVGTLLWVIGDGNTVEHWWVFAGITVLYLVSAAGSAFVPVTSSSQAGASKWSLIAGIVLGIVGFFVVPVIGLPLGYVLGIFLAEWYRARAALPAWDSTKGALKGVALSILIELAGALTMIGVWILVEWCWL